MRTFALFLALASAACLGAAAWLGATTLRFFHSDAYAPHSARLPGYTAGRVEADGAGIFLPAGLLLVAGLFLAKFAWNLWRDGRRRRKVR